MKNLKITIILTLVLAFSLTIAQQSQKEKCQAYSCFIQSAKIQYKLYKKTKLREDIYHCIELLHEATDKFGHRPELYYMLGTFYSEINAIDTVVAYFDSVKMFCEDETIDEDYRKHCYKKDNYLKSMAKLQQKFWEDSYNDAVQYLTQYDTVIARKESATGDSVRIYDSLSALALDLAKENFEMAILVKPDEVNTYLSLGALCQRAGHHQEEVDIYLKALDVAGDKEHENKDIVTRIASAYILIPDWDNSIKWFKRLLELDPENQDAMINLAASYSRNGDYENWYKYTEKVLAYQPDNTQFLFNAGQYWYQEQMRIQSDIALIGDTVPDAEVRKKDLVEQRDNAWEMSVSYYDKVAALNPQDVLTHRQLGILHLLKGNNIEAAEAFEQFVAVDSSDNDILDYLGRAYINLQKFLEAIRPYELLVQNDPGNVEAWERLEELYRYTGETDKADEAKVKAEDLKKL